MEQPLERQRIVEQNFKLNNNTKNKTMDILTNMCQWWPLWWILPAILGWLLGRAMMAKWKTRTEELENEVKDWEKKYTSLEGDLANCRTRSAELDSDLALERGRIRETERANKYLQADLDETKEKLEVAKKSAKSASSSSASPLASSTAAVTASSSLASTPTPKPEPKAPTGPTAAGEGKWAKLKTNNMQIIEGIGPKMDEVLNNNGISSWAVLAGKSFDELRMILDQEKYGAKYQIIDPTDWPAQAALAAKGDWDGLIKFQSDDGSASKAESVLVKLGIRDAKA